MDPFVGDGDNRARADEIRDDSEDDIREENGEKPLADDPEILSFARKIQAEAERIPLREDESIYRKTCEGILERRKAEYDGEILLFVVTGRGGGTRESEGGS